MICDSSSLVGIVGFELLGPCLSKDMERSLKTALSEKISFLRLWQIPRNYPQFPPTDILE
jgi:hypothetical protein